MRSTTRLTRAALAAGAAFAAVACGDVPERTAQARGVLEGINVALALTIVFVVVAVGLIVVAVGLDRFVRSRRELEEATTEPAEEEPEEEVVAGIGVGSAGAPKWLYAFYVVIPVFALLYVFNNVAVRSELAPEETPATTEAPDGGASLTELEISAANIEFDKDVLTAAANAQIELVFANDDAGIPHNVAVYESEAADTEIFVGEIFNGVADRTYRFTTLGPGTYSFRCDVHPSMEGVFEVVEAPPDGDVDGQS